MRKPTYSRQSGSPLFVSLWWVSFPAPAPPPNINPSSLTAHSGPLPPLSQAASTPAQPRGHCPDAGPAGGSPALERGGPGESAPLPGVSAGAWEAGGQVNNSPLGLLVPMLFPKVRCYRLGEPGGLNFYSYSCVGQLLVYAC